MLKQRGFLHVIAHGAWNLPAADIGIVKKPSSDPYCIISLNGRSKTSPTVYENLNPTWEHPFSFQIGSFLPQTLLLLLGARPVNHESGALQTSMMHIKVLDEDLLSADDPLGECWVDVGPIFARPCAWVAQRVVLRPPAGIAKSGIVSLSLCYEPAPFLSPYIGRMVATACFAAAFALLTISASSRWQPAYLEVGSLRQPGVGVTSILAALLMLLATILSFVVAHTGKSERLDSLAASHSASRGLSQALTHLRCCPSSSSASASAAEPVVRVQARLASFKLTSYELTVTPLVDVMKHIDLPMIILAGLMPFGGLALCILALLLQFCQQQDVVLHLLAGEVLVAAAFFSILAGLVLTVCADSQPRNKHEVMHRSLAARDSNSPSLARAEDVHTLSLDGGKIPVSEVPEPLLERERRRDVLWRKSLGKVF